MSKRLPKGNMSVMDFQKKFNSEDKCRNFFLKLRYPNGFVCPHCGGTKHGFIKTRNLIRCKTCRKQISVTSGTVFHHTHLTLQQIVWSMYLFANDKRGCSAVQLQKMLKVNYDTAYFILIRLRTAMKNRDERYMLEDIVELDDTYVGTATKGKKRGRGTEKAKVIVAVSETGKGVIWFARMKCVEDLKAGTFEQFAYGHIYIGTDVESDNCKALKAGLAKGYSVHAETYSPDKNMLVALHTIIANLKALIIGTYHGVTKERMQGYLDEFVFRFNRRDYGVHLFERLANAVFEV